MLIKSEVHLLSHLRGKQHETAIGGRELSEEERNSINLKNIVDAPEGEADPRLLAAKERVKADKRRANKVNLVKNKFHLTSCIQVAQHCLRVR